MGFFEIIMIGVGLSMDACAVAICKGLSMRKPELKSVFTIALFFGGFQAIMPLAGYLLGKQFEEYIVSVDHWIAFALLLFIGGKMIADALKGDEDPECEPAGSTDIKEIFVLAIATSIDALAVGISFAFLRVDIIPAVSVIGITTFSLSAFGVMIGNKFGARYKDKATLAGGIILILIGTRILLEHLGYI